jgi:hypothetical protein
MTHRLAAVALVLVLGSPQSAGVPFPLAAVSAQETTPTPAAEELPFQEILVDGYRYGVDPYFPCVAYIKRRVTELDPERGPVTTITMLLFIRDAAGQMQPTEPYDTPETDLTATAEVGQAWTCGPQEAIEPEAGNG